MRRRRVAALVVGLFGASAPRDARATFSVAAVDRTTGAFGAAAASCIAPSEVRIVYGPVPDHGVVIVQSFLHDGTLARGTTLLAQGVAPRTILDALLDPGFDPEPDRRQIAILSVDGDAAMHTGARALAFASHRVLATGNLRFTVQGNRLTGAPVLDRMAAAFERDGGCDLLARLRDALLAASAPGEGDALCVGRGVPADSGFLGVVLPGSSPIEITATEKGVDPLPRIATQVDALRASHPCPTAVPPPPPPADPTDPEVEGCGVAPSGTAAAGGVPLSVLSVTLGVLARRFGRRRRPTNAGGGSASPQRLPAPTGSGA